MLAGFFEPGPAQYQNVDVSIIVVVRLHHVETTSDADEACLLRALTKRAVLVVQKQPHLPGNVGR